MVVDMISALNELSLNQLVHRNLNPKNVYHNGNHFQLQGFSSACRADSTNCETANEFQYRCP